VVVELTDQAPAPVTIAAGQSVQFHNAEPLAAHQVTAAEPAAGQPPTATWTYDSGPLQPGQKTEPLVFRVAGTFLFTDQRSLAGVPVGSQKGRVVVTPPPAAAASPASSPAAAAGPRSAPPAAQTTPGSAPAGVPAPTDVGAAQLSPFSAGVAQAPTSLAGGPVVPPAVAAELGALPQAPVAAPAAVAAQPPVQALAGPLPGASNQRGLGLAATVAAVAVAGVVSLLVRVLLADPAARRPTSGRLTGAVATG
jgi:hypothetical protein